MLKKKKKDAKNAKRKKKRLRFSARLNVFTDNKCNLKDDFRLWLGETYGGKRRKCWFPAFSSFPTMFSKAFLS